MMRKPTRVSREDAPPALVVICRWGYRERKTTRQAESGMVIDRSAVGGVSKNARASRRARCRKRASSFPSEVACFGRGGRPNRTSAPAEPLNSMHRPTLTRTLKASEIRNPPVGLVYT